MTTNKINNADYVEPTTIQTPLLKLFLRYFGSFSVQLYPVSRKKPFTNILNFAWNMALVGAYFYEIVTTQGEYYRKRGESMHAMADLLKKPLFRLIVSSIMTTLFPICYFLRVFYFVALSLKKRSFLVHHLDQLSSVGDHFNIIKNQSNPFRLFVLAMIGQQFLFLLSNMKVLLKLSKNMSFFDVFMHYLTLNSLYISVNMANFLMIYCKYATLNSLKSAVERFKMTGNLDAMQNEIFRLASLNLKLSRQVSFPYIFILLPNIINTLVTLTCILIGQTKDINLFAINYLVYTTLIVSLCNAIDKQLLETQRFILIYLKKRLFKYSQLLSFEKQMSDHQSLKWIELVPLYQKCFQLKIYNFFTVNWKFFFLLYIFLSNFVVLILQTSTN